MPRASVNFEDSATERTGALLERGHELIGAGDGASILGPRQQSGGGLAVERLESVVVVDEGPNIISGSTTRGQDLSPEQRADLLDLWLDIADRHRLLACCWTPDDIKNAAARDVAPMVTMRQLDGHATALTFLRQLPKGAYIYSHPMFGGEVFDAELATAARNADVLPAGGKIAKISTADVAALSGSTGLSFKLWDGSSRRIQASLDAGAAGVVATPLCPFGTDLPAKDPALVQAAVDPMQAALDALPDQSARTGELMRQAAGS